MTALIQERGYGVTRACRLIGMSRSLHHYRSCRTGSQEVAARLNELAALKCRWGYRRLHMLLRREGYAVNRKRTYRLYREVGLAVRRRKRKRYALGERRPLPKPTAPNVSWSMDFVADALADGRELRCLNIVDDCTRECFATEVDTSLTGRRVVAVLQRLAETRGKPLSITVDHGPKIEGQALDAWAFTRGVQLAFIRPRKRVARASRRRP